MTTPDALGYLTRSKVPGAGPNARLSRSRGQGNRMQSSKHLFPRFISHEGNRNGLDIVPLGSIPKCYHPTLLKITEDAGYE